LTIPQGIINVAKKVPELPQDASNELPAPFHHDRALNSAPEGADHRMAAQRATPDEPHYIAN
jgi:hypothetical protein